MSKKYMNMYIGYESRNSSKGLIVLLLLFYFILFKCYYDLIYRINVIRDKSASKPLKGRNHSIKELFSWEHHKSRQVKVQV